MPFLGRQRLGFTLDLVLQTRTLADVPADPDTTPTLKVFTAAGAIVLNKEVPVMRPRATGLFRYDLFLGPEFTADAYYSYVFFYSIGSYYGLEGGGFQVVPGGDFDGAVHSMYNFRRPQASYVVHGKERGVVLAGKNPSLR